MASNLYIETNATSTKRLINLDTGEPVQYIEGQTYYSAEFYELVEGPLTDEMIHILMQEEMEKLNDN